MSKILRRSVTRDTENFKKRESSLRRVFQGIVVSELEKRYMFIFVNVTIHI